MEPVTLKEKFRLAVSGVSLALIIGAFVYLWWSGELADIIREVTILFGDKEHLRRYIAGWGRAAPIGFILIQAFQVVLAPIPGEATGFVGGFIFGAFWNTIYSTIGLTLGSCLAFLAARLIGAPFVKLTVSETTFKKFEYVTQRRGTVATLILFMIPGFPKDILCYLLGLSPMSFLTFLLVVAVGRIPGTILLSGAGSALYKANWWFLIGIGVCSALLLLVAYLKRDAITSWIERRSETKAEIEDQPPE